LRRLLIESLLAFVDDNYPAFNASWSEETLINPAQKSTIGDWEKVDPTHIFHAPLAGACNMK